MNNPVAFGTLTMLCSHHLFLVTECVHRPKGDPSPPPRAPTPWICALSPTFVGEESFRGRPLVSGFSHVAHRDVSEDPPAVACVRGCGRCCCDHACVWTRGPLRAVVLGQVRFAGFPSPFTFYFLVS